MSTYRTSDLALAAALKTTLRRSPAVELTSRFAEFVFSVDPSDAQPIADRFYTDELTVPARRFAQDMRDLKSLIFQARGSNDH